MDIQKMFEAIGIAKPPGKMFFTERDGVVTYDRDEQHHVGELVNNYANLIMNKRNKEKDILQLTVKINDVFSNQSTKAHNIFEDCYAVARHYGNHVFAWTILLLAYESYYNGSKCAIDYFAEKLKEITLFCRAYIKGSEYKTNEIGIDLEARILTDESGILQIEYSSQSASAIVYFHLLKLQELGLRPNICRVCGRAFFPVSKSNELYCRKQYGDGRYCADIAASNREKDNPFYSLYRTAYKTMYARMMRRGRNEIEKAKLEKWKIDAASKQIEYERNGDIEGYKQWLENSKK